MDRSSKQKINKETQVLNDKLDQMDLIDIFRTFHTNAEDWTEKKVYSSAFGWNVLKISVRSISCNVSFKTCVSLLIFCFDDLSIGVEWDGKVSYYYCVIVNFSFMSVSVCLMY